MWGPNLETWLVATCIVFTVLSLVAVIMLTREDDE